MRITADWVTEAARTTCIATAPMVTSLELTKSENTQVTLSTVKNTSFASTYMTVIFSDHCNVFTTAVAIFALGGVTCDRKNQMTEQAVLQTHSTRLRPFWGRVLVC